MGSARVGSNPTQCVFFFAYINVIKLFLLFFLAHLHHGSKLYDMSMPCSGNSDHRLPTLIGVLNPLSDIS